MARFVKIEKLSFLLSLLILAGCTKTCVGFPELGSKSQPVKFYMDNWQQSSLEPFSELSACIEKNEGYKVSFEIAADEKSVASALARKDADFGFMSALGFVEGSSRSSIEPLLVISQNGLPSTRSVILGVAQKWKELLQPLGISLSPSGLKRDYALSALDKGRFVYLNPESDVGFIVARHLLLQKNIFPEEVIFAGSYQLVLQALRKNIGLAGVVSESFIEEEWPNSIPVQLGSTLGEFVVLGVSQPLPGKVIVTRDKLPSRVASAIASGLKTCALEEGENSVKQIFLSDGFFEAGEREFEFIREIHEFQLEHPRVLTGNTDE